MPATITQLNVYPVKSCRGVALSEALLTKEGLENDRQWLIVEPGGQFLTQRELPRLALIGGTSSPMNCDSIFRESARSAFPHH